MRGLRATIFLTSLLALASAGPINHFPKALRSCNDPSSTNRSQSSTASPTANTGGPGTTTSEGEPLLVPITSSLSYSNSTVAAVVSSGTKPSKQVGSVVAIPKGSGNPVPSEVLASLASNPVALSTATTSYSRLYTLFNLTSTPGSTSSLQSPLASSIQSVTVVFESASSTPASAPIASSVPSPIPPSTSSSVQAAATSGGQSAISSTPTLSPTPVLASTAVTAPTISPVPSSMPSLVTQTVVEHTTIFTTVTTPTTPTISSMPIPVPSPAQETITDVMTIYTTITAAIAPTTSSIPPPTPTLAPQTIDETITIFTTVSPVAVPSANVPTTFPDVTSTSSPAKLPSQSAFSVDSGTKSAALPTPADNTVISVIPMYPSSTDPAAARGPSRNSRGDANLIQASEALISDLQPAAATVDGPKRALSSSLFAPTISYLSSSTAAAAASGTESSGPSITVIPMKPSSAASLTATEKVVTAFYFCALAHSLVSWS